MAAQAPRLCHLTETIGEKEIRHEIMVPVWLDVEAGMSDEDIELGLMVKAADIVGRLKQHMGVVPG